VLIRDRQTKEASLNSGSQTQQIDQQQFGSFVEFIAAGYANDAGHPFWFRKRRTLRCGRLIFVLK
jgi:hypothetical protein